MLRAQVQCRPDKRYDHARSPNWRYPPHALSSQRSFARAAAAVCHCMFQTASGPPQASGFM